MPSSKSRRRIEVPASTYERLRQLAAAEERTVSNLLHELLLLGLAHYQPTWMPRTFHGRFDDDAKRVLAWATEEAQMSRHSAIGTEHLLLGLLRSDTGIAAYVLRRLWIDPDEMRQAVSSVWNLQPPSVVARALPPAEGEIGYTPRARKVLALAVDEAQRLNDDRVGTEHVLLAIDREGEGIAARMLRRFGVASKVREFTLEARNEQLAAVCDQAVDSGVADRSGMGCTTGHGTA
jgi:ATP-dependent Clp protease ATP-binding subunit ClpA